MRTLGWCTQTGASEQEERGWSMNSGGWGGELWLPNVPNHPQKTRVDAESLRERSQQVNVRIFSLVLFQSSITSRWNEASTLPPMRMERLSPSRSLCQTDKSPRLGPLFSFQMWNRWIFFLPSFHWPVHNGAFTPPPHWRALPGQRWGGPGFVLLIVQPGRN